MTNIARTPDVLSAVKAALHLEATAAASGNQQVSKAEQSKLEDGLLKSTADQLRNAGASRVTVDSLTEAAATRVAVVLGQVNQASGSGAGSVSQKEIRAAAAVLPEAGVRLARAYELITGRHIELPGNTTTAPPPPVATGMQPVTTVVASSDVEARVLSGGAIQLGQGVAGSTITLQVGGRAMTARVANEPLGDHNNGVATSGDVVEALRSAATTAGYDVRVIAHGAGHSTVELWAAGSAPPPPVVPTYLHAKLVDASGARKVGIEIRGPLSFMGGNINPGDHLIAMVDGKRYDIPCTTSTDVLAELKNRLEGDGRTVDYRSYSGWFKVTG